MPPKPKLSGQALLDKRARDQLLYLANRVKLAWSFSKLKTFGDLLKEYGQSLEPYFASELNQPLTFKDIKDFLQDKNIELETSIWLRNNPPQISTNDELSSSKLSEPIQSAAQDATIKSSEDEEKAIAAEYAKRVPIVRRSKAFLFWFQKKGIVQLAEQIFTRGHTAAYLVSQTGSGKTWIAGHLLAHLIESEFHKGKTFTPWPYIYVTKSQVVEQTRRVLANVFGIKEDECLVIGIDQLRSQFGRRFVREVMHIKQGEEHYKWVWNNNLWPICIFWDEAHALKNYTSQQHKIGCSYNDIDFHGVKPFQLFISASPGTRVCEFKCFCVATRIAYSFDVQKNAPLTNDHWTDFAKNMASDYGRLEVEPEEHSPGAINRLFDYMDKYVVRVKGIRPQFRAINKIRLLHFETEVGRKEYNDAWEKFQEEKAQIEGNDGLSNAESVFNILAKLTIFLKAAESNTDRVNLLTREGFHDVREGFAAVYAMKYKVSILRCVIKLIQEYGVSRDQISLIWGGAPQLNKKQKLKKSIVNNELLQEILAKEGLTLNSLDLDDVDIVEPEKYPKEYRLGPQNAKERQKEIDRFQTGKSLYCFYTFRAGGVGLSLHHTDEFTEQKVRRKESGYAFEEDIPNIPTRQRITRIAPVWSAIEGVQGVGRVPRLTSLSDTPQWLMYFAGTVEERQARVMGCKLHCLTKVIRNRESWEDLIIGRKGITDEEVEKMHITDASSSIAKAQEQDEAEESTGYGDEDED